MLRDILKHKHNNIIVHTNTYRCKVQVSCYTKGSSEYSNRSMVERVSIILLIEKDVGYFYSNNIYLPEKAGVRRGKGKPA